MCSSALNWVDRKEMPKKTIDVQDKSYPRLQTGTTEPRSAKQQSLEWSAKKPRLRSSNPHGPREVHAFQFCWSPTPSRSNCEPGQIVQQAIFSRARPSAVPSLSSTLARPVTSHVDWDWNMNCVEGTLVSCHIWEAFICTGFFVCSQWICSRTTFERDSSFVLPDPRFAKCGGILVFRNKTQGRLCSGICLTLGSRAMSQRTAQQHIEGALRCKSQVW